LLCVQRHQQHLKQRQEQHGRAKSNLTTKTRAKWAEGRQNKEKWGLEKWAGHRQWVSEMKISRGRKYK